MFVFQMVSGFSLGFFYSWELSGIMLIGAPLMIAAGAVITIVFNEFTKQGQAAYASAGATCLETLNGLRTVWANGAEAHAVDAYARHVAIATAAGVKKALSNGLSFGFVNSLFYGMYALGLGYGALSVEQGKLTPGRE